MIKLKDIAKLCKAAQLIYLYDQKMADGGIRQWISDGKAMYSVEEMPYMEMNHIETVFDLNDKQRDEFSLHHTDLPSCFCTDETTPNEILVEQDAFALFYRGESLLPINDEEHIHLVQAKYIDPVMSNSAAARIYLRETEHKTPYLVIKEGLFIKAIILDTYQEHLNETFIAALTRLWNSCRANLYFKANGEEGRQDE